MFLRIFLLSCLTVGYTQAQDIQYVTAENGLVIRSKPNRGAPKLDKLVYGTPVEIMEHTNLHLDVVDKGEKLKGEWVKVRGIDAYDFFEEGYVFNGFLTEEKLQKRFNQPYKAFTVTIEGISEKEAVKDKINPDFNAVLFYKLDDGETFEGKTIRIKHHQEYRSIEVFQKHENSIAISDDKSHCDLINWKHYYSSWKPLKTISNNHKFTTLPISEKEANRFIEVDIEVLKTVVQEECGASWSSSIKDIKSVYDYPASIAISKMYLRVVMIDLNGFKTEKIIIFEVPFDSNTKTEAYAKF